MIAKWNVIDPLSEKMNTGVNMTISMLKRCPMKVMILMLPKAEKNAGNSAIYYNSSAYAYVLNNPLSYIDPLGLDTAKVNQLREVTIQGSKGINPWGPSLILLGQPTVPKDSRVVKYFFDHAFVVGKNKNTSVASLASRVAVRKLEQKAGKRVAKVIGKKASSFFKRLGGLIGRTVPGVSWTLTASDAWEYRAEIGEFMEGWSAGAARYYELRSNPNTF